MGHDCTAKNFTLVESSEKLNFCYDLIIWILASKNLILIVKSSYPAIKSEWNEYNLYCEARSGFWIMYNWFLFSNIAAVFVCSSFMTAANDRIYSLSKKPNMKNPQKLQILRWLIFSSHLSIIAISKRFELGSSAWSWIEAKL